METDYIKRSDAIEALHKAHSPYPRRRFISVEAIKNIPAADVRPVVRGRWITEEEAERMDDYSRADTCSVCGHCDWDCTESRWFNFCPNCGAKMGGTP